MKITSLTIAPVNSWTPLSPANPLKAVVKLASDNATVETVIPEDMMEPLLRMVAGIVSRAAVQNVNDFARACEGLEAVADVPRVTA